MLKVIPPPSTHPKKGQYSNLLTGVSFNMQSSSYLIDRCHDPSHTAADCKDFGDLKCPRCLEWDHWEDTCWTNLTSEDKETCETCNALGHAALVHDVKNFKQRRAIVDTLGWQPFTNWFFENEFR